MTALQPQTIVIKTVPARTPTTLTVTSQFEHDMLDDLYGDGDAPRKRRRLTHLSQEEKLLRRKLKNRVAAQTARDRKKNFMSELEQKVAELEQENKKLQQENKALKSESGNLHKQNVELKGRLSILGSGSVKTEVVSGSAARTDPTCVILDQQHLHSFNVDSKSDTLVSLLPTFNQSQIANKNSLTTVEISSLPGSTRNHGNTEESSMVGPSSKELESFKELMQFDHVYFKPQPKGKTNSSGQLKVSPSVLNKVKNESSIRKVTENGNNVKNVQIVITSDLPDVQYVKESDLIVPSQNSESNGMETINVDEYDSDMLNNLNFDLLEDLENILKADTDGLACPNNNYLQSQKDKNGLVINEKNRQGQKRKTSEIETIVDTLKCNVPDKELTVDSVYVSDIPSPYSASSPYSSQSLGSPLSDTNIESPLTDSVWEESFTELFPDLM